MAKYTFKEAEKPTLPTIDILERDDGLLVATFGSNTYSTNTNSMDGPYFNSGEHPNLTFRPATTAESLEVAAGDFKRTKDEILDPRWLQAGRIGRASEGVYANLPMGEDGRSVVDEETLKAYLNSAKKVNGIYLVPNGEVEGLRDFGFAPYESFKVGDEQDVEDFVRGGLARALEHTGEDVASNLAVIASKENYPKGVNVWGFGQADKGEIDRKSVV